MTLFSKPNKFTNAAKRLWMVAATTFVVFFTTSVFARSVESYDLLIKNARVFNGQSWLDQGIKIAIRKDRMVLLESTAKVEAIRIIDAKGLVVAPGFIDMHAHLDPLLSLPGAESHVRQGVTTALGGPDGNSPWPLADYLAQVERKGIGINVAYLVGHNTIRKNIMQLQNRAPTEDELRQMESQVRQGMKEGAFGLSTGLKYLPGAFSKVEEVIALSKIAAYHGGIYTSHLREEGVGLIESVAEAIQIGREANIPIVLTHHKVVGSKMWGASRKTLAMVDQARAEGVDVMIDQYPYIASYTDISVLIPAWARAGGNGQFKKRVADKQLRRRIKNEIIENIKYDRGGGDLHRVQFAKVKWQPELEGKTLYDWAVQKKMAPSIENGAELVIEAQLNGGASCVFFAMDDTDLKAIMRHPQTMIASDGRLVMPGQGHPHPRWYGTFPRVLGKYVREEKVITLAEALRKMTSMPAQRLGLKRRGRIRSGYYADLVIFDPDTIIDTATFERPHQYPEGISYVIVNGKLTVDKGLYIDSRAGKVLRKNGPE